MTWLGHSSVLLEMDGVRLVTDPALRRRVAYLVRAAPVPSVALQDADAVLISHAHYDHLDLPTLARIGHGVTIVVAAGSARMLTRRGFQRVLEVAPDDSLQVDGLSLQVTRADHAGGRHGRLGPASVAVGFLVGGSRRVYFAGDTAVFGGMAALSPGLDLALIPIWGWGARLGSGHLGPLDAAQALALLQPRMAVPIHYATYHACWQRDSGAAASVSALEDFKRHAAEQAPSVSVRVLAVGQSLELGE